MEKSASTNAREMQHLPALPLLLPPAAAVLFAAVLLLAVGVGVP